MASERRLVLRVVRPKSGLQHLLAEARAAGQRAAAPAPRFVTAREAQEAGPWTITERMPDGRYVNAGAMTRDDHLELASKA